MDGHAPSIFVAHSNASNRLFVSPGLLLTRQTGLEQCSLRGGVCQWEPPAWLS